MQGDEYARLSGNEKQQVNKFLFDNYAHRISNS